MGRSRCFRWGALLLASILVVLSACGDDSSAASGTGEDQEAGSEGSPGTGDANPGDPPDEGQEQPAIGSAPASAPLASAADSSAAAGSGLTDPPGPAERAPFPDFGEVAIAVTGFDGTVTGWCTLLAETGDQRSQGLMQVTDLGGYAGMLFVHDEEQPQKFWMRNTPMPLSIAWFDNEGRFVSSADMEPFDEACEQCRSDGPARFSLEVPQGELPGMGIGEGSTLRVGGSCA